MQPVMHNLLFRQHITKQQSHIGHITLQGYVFCMKSYVSSLGLLDRERTCSTWSRRFRKFSLRYVSTLVMMPSSLILSFSSCLLSCEWTDESKCKIQLLLVCRPLRSSSGVWSSFEYKKEKKRNLRRKLQMFAVICTLRSDGYLHYFTQRSMGRPQAILALL